MYIGEYSIYKATTWQRSLSCKTEIGSLKQRQITHQKNEHTITKKHALKYKKGVDPEMRFKLENFKVKIIIKKNYIKPF